MSSVLWRLVGISLRKSCYVRNSFAYSHVSHRQYYKLTRNSINQWRTTRAAPTGALPWAQRCMRVDSSPWVRRSAFTGAQLNATRFRPRVTLTFDLLNPKVERLLPLPRRSLVPTGIKIGSRCQHIMFTGLVTDERTDGRGGSTGEGG